MPLPLPVIIAICLVTAGLVYQSIEYIEAYHQDKGPEENDKRFFAADRVATVLIYAGALLLFSYLLARGLKIVS